MRMLHSRMSVGTLWLEGGRKFPEGLGHYDLIIYGRDEPSCRGA